MKRNGKLWVMLGVLAVAAAFTLTGCLKPHGCGAKDPERMRKMVTRHIDDLLDEIEATDPQRAQINAIKDELLPKVAKMHQAAAASHRTLLAELLKDAPDAALVHRTIDEGAESHKACAHEMADAALKVSAILTPAQRQKIGEELEDFGFEPNEF